MKGTNATNSTLKKAAVESEKKIKLLDSKIKSFESKLSSSTKGWQINLDINIFKCKPARKYRIPLVLNKN